MLSDDEMSRLGRNHPTIRRVRELRRDPARRRAEAVFVAEGRHLAAEALASGATIELLLFSDRLRQTEAGVVDAMAATAAGVNGCARVLDEFGNDTLYGSVGPCGVGMGATIF